MVNCVIRAIWHIWPFSLFSIAFVSISWTYLFLTYSCAVESRASCITSPTVLERLLSIYFAYDRLIYEVIFCRPCHCDVVCCKCIPYVASRVKPDVDGLWSRGGRANLRSRLASPAGLSDQSVIAYVTDHRDTCRWMNTAWCIKIGM